MAASVVIAGAWDFAAYGSCTLKLTDDVVTTPTSVTFSAGAYDPGFCLSLGITSPALNDWCKDLGDALTAVSPTRTYVVTFAAGRYTITTAEGVVFNLQFSGLGAAGARFGKLLGFSYDPHSATTYTSDRIPYFVIVPAIGGLTADSGVTRRSGVSKSATNANGGRYVLRPTSIPRVRSWEHHFEPKERVDADYLALASVAASSSHYYSWEQLWTDYGTAMLPIGMQVVDSAGKIETTAFSLDTPEYDRSVKTRMRPNDDVRWKIRVDATLWPGATANSYARAFS